MRHSGFDFDYTLVALEPSINNYTREEIEVKFILDCLFAESKNHRTSEVHNIMAMSVLEFISKIPGQSDLCPTPVYRDRIGKI